MIGPRRVVSTATAAPGVQARARGGVGFAGGCLLAALSLAAGACGPDKPVRGALPRRPAAPGATSVEPPPRPQYSEVGPRRVATKPGQDRARAPLTELVGPETSPDEVEALRYAERARRELEAGTTTHAFTLLDAAIERSPRTAPLYVVRAQAFVADGSFDRARQDLRTAVDLAPGPAWLAEAVAVHGGILELEGDLDGAVAAYRRALAISAANVTAREALRRLSER